MKRSAFGLLAIAFGACLAVSPALAHHPFAAEYDNKKPVTLKGIITKVDWTNPHVYFFVDVKDEKGDISNWGFEMGPPGLLQRAGWTRHTMNVGEKEVVEGPRPRGGSNRANAR